MRMLHQVYEKMLNYMIKHICLPSMAPLKHGCKGVRGYRECFGVRVCGGIVDIEG